MKEEDIIRIAKVAANHINPSLQRSIVQLEGSTNPEIRIGVDTMKQTQAKNEHYIAEAIREALLWEQRSRSDIEHAFAGIRKELERAMAKFPTWPTDPLHAFAVVGEEFGEAQKEVLQLTYEPHKSSREELRKEAVQLAAMSLRFLMSFDRYEFTPGVQHSQNAGFESSPERQLLPRMCLPINLGADAPAIQSQLLI